MVANQPTFTNVYNPANERSHKKVTIFLVNTIKIVDFPVAMLVYGSVPSILKNLVPSPPVTLLLAVTSHSEVLSSTDRSRSRGFLNITITTIRYNKMRFQNNFRTTHAFKIFQTSPLKKHPHPSLFLSHKTTFTPITIHLHHRKPLLLVLDTPNLAPFIASLPLAPASS